MKLIIGLGNPGRAYIDSRHNIGFAVVRALAKDWKITLKKESQASSLVGRVKFKSQNVLLAIPMTFMNLSGIAVAELVNKYDIDLANILVVCDDLDLELGRIKIKPGGSSGGHRGLKSIIDSLETGDFSRLRIGIGRSPQGAETSDYVLSAFNKQEKAKAEKVVEKAAECCLTWLRRGISESMNVFNRAH